MAELAPAAFRTLLRRRKFAQIAAHAVTIESRTNLLFSFEKMALRDAVKPPEGAQAFAEGLYELLHGRASEERRFERWCETVAGLPRRQTRVLTWPIVTVFGFVAHPDRHVFLKPNVTRVAAREYEFDFQYASRPNWSTYASLLDFAARVLRDQRDLGPRDMASGCAVDDAHVDSYGARRVLPKLRSPYPGAGLIEQYRVRNEGGRTNRGRGGRSTTRQGNDGEECRASGPSKREEHLRFSVYAGSAGGWPIPAAGAMFRSRATLAAAEEFRLTRRSIRHYLRPEVEMLRLRTLGGLALECNGTRLESVAGRRRALALLAQMAVAGPRGVSRARLVHRLWPDSDEDKARNVLAQTLHKLKREIGGAEIVTGTNELRLDDALISSDVREFERQVSAGLLEQAALLYDGPFLDGFYVNGADEFERWAEDERSRLARLAGETFEGLAHQADRAGDVGTAVTWWRRLTTLDPLATRATLGLMTALAASGDTADSLRVGSVYQALVRNELGAAPDPAVERLVNEVRSGALAPRRPVSSRQEPTPAVEPAPSREPNEPDSLSVEISPVTSRWRGRRFWYVGVAVAAVAAAAYASRGRTPSAESPSPPPATVPIVGSIAVLPLVNLDRSTADDYFIDGVAEEIATTLSRVPGLRVGAYTSALAFKGVSADAPHIASALGVQTLLEGSVRRTGSRARIALRLVNGFDGFPLMPAPGRLGRECNGDRKSVV